MKKKSLKLISGLTAIALITGGVVGYIVSSTPNNNLKPQVVSKVVKTIQPLSDTINSKDMFNGMLPVNPKWFQMMQKNGAENINNQRIKIPTNKPIIFAAYWCPYCHKTLQLLSKNHLLSKFTIVAVAFNGKEGKFATNVNVNNGKKGAEVFQQSLNQIDVSIPANKMLYVMPTDKLNNNFEGFPTVLFPHNGKWYAVNGFINDINFWKISLNIPIKVSNKTKS